jgi:hypothetical protein
MRKVLVPLWLVVSILTGANAYSDTTAVVNPENRPTRPAQSVSLEQQLAHRISYPKTLGSSDAGRVVVIQFKVDANNRLGQLEIFSQNQALNNELTRQLVGQKLTLTNRQPEETYTARLRFEANE